MVSFESSGILWRVLRVVERTVLPRTITFRTARGRLDMDVSNQCVMLCPKLDGAFVVDEQFRLEAPQAYEVVRRGALSQSGELSRPGGSAGAVALYNDALTTLASSREALLGLWGRALAGLCDGAAEVETEIEAADFFPTQQTTAYRRLGFGALELLSALTPHVALAEDSLVQAFYDAQRSVVSDAWLFHLAGWPVAFPRETVDLSRVDEMGRAAGKAREWRSNLAGVPGPIMGVMIGGGHDVFLCVAVDDVYVALISRPSGELGPALAAWRTAQQSRGGEQTSSLLLGGGQHAGVAQSSA